jgi:hypothetical protein
VNPVPSTSHLQVAQEGLQLLESIDTPVAPIVVIGPYRSGKSFLLNQLLGVSCSEYLGAKQHGTTWVPAGVGCLKSHAAALANSFACDAAACLQAECQRRFIPGSLHLILVAAVAAKTATDG